MSNSLQEIWSHLTKDLNDNKNEWWLKITNRMNDSKRKYHNLGHLEKKLELFNSIQECLKDPKAVQYALFFSYFEYEPKSTDTDKRNIEHFKLFCEDCGVPIDSDIFKNTTRLLGYIGSHITEEHQVEGIFGQEDKHYFLDLDMAILGSPPEVYNTYSEKVQEEYDFLTPDMYRVLRIKVLQTFSQIPNIFSTKEFREKFEAQARSNIQAEVLKLQKK